MRCAQLFNTKHAGFTGRQFLKLLFSMLCYHPQFGLFTQISNSSLKNIEQRENPSSAESRIYILRYLHKLKSLRDKLVVTLPLRSQYHITFYRKYP